MQSEALANAIANVDAQAEELSSILDAMRALEQRMHAPVETLETGVAALTAATTQEEQQLRRLRRAVMRLREFARSMPDITAHRFSRLLRA